MKSQITFITTRTRTGSRHDKQVAFTETGRADKPLIRSEMRGSQNVRK